MTRCPVFAVALALCACAPELELDAPIEAAAPPRSGSAALAEAATLHSGDGITGDDFGRSVALDGDTALIGAQNVDNGTTINVGAAYVYVRTVSGWAEQAKLSVGSPDQQAEERFGYSVALQGDRAVVGAYRADATGMQQGPGAVYVFTRNGSSWTQSAKLVALDRANIDQFGVAVALDGDTIVVGANNEEANSSTNSNRGAAYVFVFNGSTWEEQTKLVATDFAANHLFGSAVAISGDTVVIGAPTDIAVLALTGSAYVFSRTGTTWSQQGKLTPADGTADDEFGAAVAVAGDTAVIGARRHDHGTTDAGGAYVFTRSASTWTFRVELQASARSASDFFGSAVALQDGAVAIGAYGVDSSTLLTAGAAYLFEGAAASWSLVDKLVATAPDGNELLGWSVALRDRAVLVGAPFSGTAANHQRGAAYFFVPRGATCSTQAPCAGALSCVDGVCCLDACNGFCERCDVADHLGQCWPVADGTDPDGECSGSGLCAGHCDGVRACAFPDSTQLCDLCTACDGTGSCDQITADDPACGDIACGALSTTCRTYQDLQADRCDSLGVCVTPDLQICTSFSNTGNGTPCACAGGGPGLCLDGDCPCNPLTDAAVDDAASGVDSASAVDATSGSDANPGFDAVTPDAALSDAGGGSDLPPPADAATTPDTATALDSASSPDTSPADAASTPDTGASSDLSPGSDASAGVDSASAVDAAGGNDAVLVLDSGADVDVGSAPDSSTSSDATTQVDASTQADAVTQVDASTPSDVAAASDSTTQADAAVQQDALSQLDAASLHDAGAGVDAVRPGDGGHDVVPEKPEEGGCQCASGAMPDRAWWVLGLGLLLLRRRRG
ncbi:MAG: hypothetical protein ABIJ09_19865 [Pseudomonadota bacterium]